MRTCVDWEGDAQQYFPEAPAGRTVVGWCARLNFTGQEYAEIAKLLGCHPGVVGRHVRALRMRGAAGSDEGYMRGYTRRANSYVAGKGVGDGGRRRGRVDLVTSVGPSGFMAFIEAAGLWEEFEEFAHWYIVEGHKAARAGTLAATLAESPPPWRARSRAG